MTEIQFTLKELDTLITTLNSQYFQNLRKDQKNDIKETKENSYTGQVKDLLTKIYYAKIEALNS